MEPKTFHKLGYGMYVVSSKKGEHGDVIDYVE